MANVLPFSNARGARPRQLVGVHLDESGRRLTIAGVAVHGEGLQSRIEIRSFDQRLCASLPARSLATAAASHQSLPWEAWAELRAAVAEEIAEAVNRLPAETFHSGVKPSALGLVDPGCWKPMSQGSWLFAGLCDSARLAEAAGLPVIDSFPAADLAKGGRGGPINALPYWLLLRDPRRDRVLIDLGRTARLAYLPAECRGDPLGQLRSSEAGPGTALLDALVVRLTGGQQSFDPGGRLAVQGRHIPELLDHWMRDSYFDRPLPRWHPRGVRPERFLNEPLQWAIGRGWSIRDMLCTATHFVAAAVAKAIAQLAPMHDHPIEIVAAGGGQNNGLLLREIAARAQALVTPITQNIARTDAIDAVCAALLALCRIDDLPAGLPACTGAAAPVVLGSIQPGSSAAWQRLLHAMHRNEQSDYGARRAAG